MLLTSLVLGLAIIVCPLGIALIVRAPRRFYERAFPFLALVVTLCTLIVTTVQDQQTETNSSKSALAAQQSVFAARQALEVEQAPALVIGCVSGAQGKENELLILVPNSQSTMVVTQPWLKEVAYNYATCVIRNFGRQPILAAQMPLTYQFYRVLSPGKGHLLGTKTISVGISGIAAQSSSILWIENKSVRLYTNVIRPKRIIFFEPSLPRRPMLYLFPFAAETDVTVLPPANLPPGALKMPGFRDMP